MRTGMLMCAVAVLSLAAAVGAPQADLSKEARSDRVAMLIEQLGDDEFDRREEATQELDTIGHLALDALRKAADSRDAEVQQRADRLIEAITARPAPVPKGAIVLFDGKDLSGWMDRDGKDPAWVVRDGFVEVVPGKGDILTARLVGPDFRLHVEFWLPLLPDKQGPARANSGVYLLGRHEVQVFDSYRNEIEPVQSAGALYGLIAPDREAQKKAVKPPERWNAYDITFRAPRLDKRGQVTEKGKLTVVLNGVKITAGEFDRVLEGSLALDDTLVSSGPILLQDHGSAVRFRNIWLVPAGK